MVYLSSLSDFIAAATRLYNESERKEAVRFVSKIRGDETVLKITDDQVVSRQVYYRRRCIQTIPFILYIRQCIKYKTKDVGDWQEVHALVGRLATAMASGSNIEQSA